MTIDTNQSITPITTASGYARAVAQEAMSAVIKGRNLIQEPGEPEHAAIEAALEAGVLTLTELIDELAGASVIAHEHRRVEQLTSPQEPDFSADTHRSADGNAVGGRARTEHPTADKDQDRLLKLLSMHD